MGGGIRTAALSRGGGPDASNILLEPLWGMVSGGKRDFGVEGGSGSGPVLEVLGAEAPGHSLVGPRVLHLDPGPAREDCAREGNAEELLTLEHKAYDPQPVPWGNGPDQIADFQAMGRSKGKTAKRHVRTMKIKQAPKAVI